MKHSAAKMAAKDRQNDLLFEISSPEAIKPRFQYMKNLIKASRVITMWPKSEETNTVLHHTKIWTLLFICVTFTLTFILKVVKEFKNLDVIAQLIDFMTVYISGFFRYIYVHLRGDRYIYMVSLIHNDFVHFPIITNARGASLDKHYKYANKLILSYSIFTLFWILQVCTIPLIGYVWALVSLPPNSTETVPYPLPIKVYIPFDYQKQPGWVVALFYIHQCVGFTAFGWIYVVIDSFWYMVIMLTIGQFSLIKASLKTITEALKKAEEEGQILNESQIRKVECGLKQCIVHHQFVRRFVRMADDLVNPIILVDYLHAMISIGFILLDATVSLNNGDWNKLMYSFEYFITSIVHMFFFDWLGNKLTDKEKELANAIYDFPWYKFPGQKTTFLLITARARKPCKLTGGRMFSLSLQYFGTTIRAIFSYFTFLLQVRNNE